MFSYLFKIIRIRRKLTYEERVYWFIYHYYETGMEFSILLISLKNEDLENFKWYDEVIKFPKYRDEINNYKNLVRNMKRCKAFYKL